MFRNARYPPGGFHPGPHTEQPGDSYLLCDSRQELLYDVFRRIFPHIQNVNAFRG